MEMMVKTVLIYSIVTIYLGLRPRISIWHLVHYCHRSTYQIGQQEFHPCSNNFVLSDATYFFMYYIILCDFEDIEIYFRFLYFKKDDLQTLLQHTPWALYSTIS